MARLNPNAALDCLFIVDYLRKHQENVTSQKVHLFSYLACLLWLFSEQALSNWEYNFVGTELGAPFSQEIDAVIEEFNERGYIIKHSSGLKLSELAVNRLKAFAGLSMNESRIKCLQAACETIMAFSSGMIGAALSNEPDLKRAYSIQDSRMLLEDSARDQLYVQFAALKKALKQNGTDLRLPALIWITALYQSNEQVAEKS